MRWLWFIGSLVCFAVMFRTTSIALALICLVGALAFMLIGTLAVAAQRIDRNRNDDVRMLGPEELRHIREAEARRKADQQPAQAAIVGVAAASAMIAAEAGDRVVSEDAIDADGDPDAASD
ncbi:MAG TPA: hypothetical protein VFN29_02665 [Chiayiivirga sp.]|nr:hypothetical protein [Chiayiivirga sp.]